MFGGFNKPSQLLVPKSWFHVGSVVVFVDLAMVKRVRVRVNGVF